MKMNRTRKGLFLTTSIARRTPLRRDGEEGGGGTGGESGDGGDNKPVKGESGGSGGDPNAGQGFDYQSFWAAKEPKADDDDSGGSEEDAGKALGTQLVSQISSFKPDDIFTPAALQKMADGDLSDLNGGIQKSFQAGMTQMLGITAQLMKAFEGHFEKRLESTVASRIEGSRTSQNDEKMLGENFKAFANPATRPVIQGIFNKSLEHSSGDRKKALELTRGMLQTMGQHGKDDFGFGRFNDPDNNLDEGPSRLVQELLELKR